jgi:hypothetical protein
MLEVEDVGDAACTVDDVEVEGRVQRGLGWVGSAARLSKAGSG